MTSEIKAAVQDINEAWHEFKKANDERLEGIEKTGEELSEQKAKVDQIEEKMSTLEELQTRLEKAEIKLDSPGFTQGDNGKAEAEQLKAFDEMIRSVKFGEKSFSREKEAAYLEATKAVSIGTTTAGGHAVPEVVSRQIDQKLLDISVMLPLVKMVTVGTSDYKELVDVRGASGGWVGELGYSPDMTRSETNTPVLQQVAPTFGIVYAYPKATEESMQDIFFDVQNWLVDAAAEEFDRLIGISIISGNGTNKPTGFLNGTPVDEDDEDASPTRPFGTIQYIASGVAGGFQKDRLGSPIGNPVDPLITTVYKLKAGYRSNARWLMNKGTLATVRKWKDNDAQYIWEPSMQMGQPSSVLGFPVSEMEDMPDEGTNTFPIAFGDFNAGYTFCNRVGTSITVDDNITTPGYVKFYIRRRVGGILRNDDAIKVVKCAAS
jgi:HK97 family phage major capsid protein